MSRPDQLVEIHVDHREVGSGVPECLEGLESVRLVVESLDVGDYVLGSGVVVERKTTADFVASIIDKRLFAQVEQMTAAYGTVICLLEGKSLFSVGSVHPNALRGALSYLAVLRGVTILPTQDASDSAQMLGIMARHAQYGLGYELSLHRVRRSDSPQLRMRYLVEDLPGIGPKTADALLAHFGTLQALFEATEPELREVLGMGAKRARQVRALLSTSYTP